MGKSTVLKDGSGRAAGYVMTGEAELLCRADLDAPAMLVMIYADGSRQEYPLAACKGEQRCFFAQKAWSGCYVFRDNVLLLVSCAHMRGEFERELLRRNAIHAQTDRPGAQRDAETKPEKKSAAKTEMRPETNEEKQNRERTENMLPQRRWPPPPCWDGARYRDGHWQEE